MQKYGSTWSHDEVVLALGLYFQMPFGKIHSRSFEVRRLAKLMNRSPASLSMKMCNFGRLDPSLAKRGVSGLKNGAKMDQTVWDEYVGRRDELATRYHELLLKLKGDENFDDDVAIKTPQGLDGVRLAHYRINQSFFRRSVLSAYDNACCITGLTGVKLLIASHIKPWSKCIDGNERTDTANGLCLNSLHDSLRRARSHKADPRQSRRNGARHPTRLNCLWDGSGLFHQVRGAADCIARTWPTIRNFPFLSS